MKKNKDDVSSRGRRQAESTVDFLGRWVNAILSENGPCNARQRLVLVAIGHIMRSSAPQRVRESLDRCRIGHAAIMVATKLSRKSVSNHIREAIEGGWLRREHPRGFGQAWATYEYDATIPWSVGAVRSTGNKVGAKLPHLPRRNPNQFSGDQDAPG